MHGERERDWPRVRSIFQRALDLPPAERGAFVASECREEPELLESVLRLIDADAAADGFLEPPGVPPGA